MVHKSHKLLFGYFKLKFIDHCFPESWEVLSCLKLDQTHLRVLLQCCFGLSVWELKNKPIFSCGVTWEQNHQGWLGFQGTSLILGRHKCPTLRHCLVCRLPPGKQRMFVAGEKSDLRYT